ncbi:MAG: hypothetical protein AB7Q69_04235 [Gemmatimonadales bacterium]
MPGMRMLFGALLSAGLLAACSDASAPGSNAQISLSVATRGAGTTPAPQPASPDTVTIGTDVLVLEQVELVLKEIELERQHDDACDSLSGSDHEACEEFETGPFLLDLPLGVGAEHQITITADTGTFDEIKFKIHKPEDDGDAADQAFLAEHPDLNKISIRVTGTFNGTPFTYTTDLGAEQEIHIDPPLVVTESSAVDVTLFVDVRGWFMNGGALIDPAQALKGQPFEAVVQSNIESSFDAFHDDDHDGRDDDD